MVSPLWDKLSSQRCGKVIYRALQAEIGHCLGCRGNSGRDHRGYLCYFDGSRVKNLVA